MLRAISLWRFFAISVLVSQQIGCGGDGGMGDSTTPTQTPTPRTYSIGGNVSGLAGTGLMLQVSGKDDLAVAADGPFTFSTSFQDASTYSVSVSRQPSNPAQNCLVTRGTGTIAARAVTDVVVTCTTNSYAVGGNVTGLVGTLALRDNGHDLLSISSNGPFTFSTSVASGALYSVEVLTQPPDQQCTLTGASGTIANEDIVNITVACVPTYSLGGTTSGLVGTVVLRSDSGGDLTVSANGPFTLPTQQLNGTRYAVSIVAQPTGQQCTVTSGSGTITLANVTSIRVSCESTYTVAGAVFGLVGTLVLQNNGEDNLTVSRDGSFTFPTALIDDSSYKVTLMSNPDSQRCMVIRGSGVISGGNVSNIKVSCNTLRASRYAYVISVGTTNSPQKSLLQYTIGTDGTLTSMTPGAVATGGSPTAIAVDPSGQHAYVTNIVINDEGDDVEGTVWQYRIGGDGRLAPMTPATVAAGFNPTAIAIDAKGKYAYALNLGPQSNLGPEFFSGSISQYSISPDGSLAPSTPASIALDEENPTAIALDPSGRYAYVTTQDTSTREVRILQYNIDSNGRLTPMIPASFSVDLIGTRVIKADPFGRGVYVLDGAFSRVLQYAIEDNGNLSPLNPSSVFSATLFPSSFAIDPTGQYAFAGAPATISQYSVDASGRLTLSPDSVSTDGAGPMAIDASGKYAYAIVNTEQSNVRQYAIGSDGRLTPLTPAAINTGAGATGIAVSP
jgi:hypothetical protein